MIDTKSFSTAGCLCPRRPYLIEYYTVSGLYHNLQCLALRPQREIRLIFDLLQLILTYLVLMEYITHRRPFKLLHRKTSGLALMLGKSLKDEVEHPGLEATAAEHMFSSLAEMTLPSCTGCNHLNPYTSDHLLQCCGFYCC